MKFYGKWETLRKKTQNFVNNTKICKKVKLKWNNTILKWNFFYKSPEILWQIRYFLIKTTTFQ